MLQPEEIEHAPIDGQRRGREIVQDDRFYALPADEFDQCGKTRSDAANLRVLQQSGISTSRRNGSTFGTQTLAAPSGLEVGYILIHRE
jgi:hypothetical protein